MVIITITISIVIIILAYPYIFTFNNPKLVKTPAFIRITVSKKIDVKRLIENTETASCKAIINPRIGVDNGY
jgi:hypothetical protein